MVYDITKEASFENVAKWLAELKVRVRVRVRVRSAPCAARYPSWGYPGPQVS